VDNFDISHSEKDFLGAAGEGKRRVVHYWGTLSSQCCLDDIVIVNANDREFSLSN
jgi:hypothetical protein